jgi:hypothetical protein
MAVPLCYKRWTQVFPHRGLFSRLMGGLDYGVEGEHTTPSRHTQKAKGGHEPPGENKRDTRVQ